MATKVIRQERVRVDRLRDVFLVETADGQCRGVVEKQLEPAQELDGFPSLRLGNGPSGQSAQEELQRLCRR